MSNSQIRKTNHAQREVQYTYDSIHQLDTVNARFFDENYSHDIADYDYFGPGRLVKKTYGNDAFLTVGYDDKRRIDSYVTKLVTSDKRSSC